MNEDQDYASCEATEEVPQIENFKQYVYLFTKKILLSPVHSLILGYPQKAKEKDTR